jgi:hypothetical protein
MRGFGKPDFIDRQDTAAKAKKAALAKFRASAADPAFAERQAVRVANADARRGAKIEKAEKKAQVAERALQAERDAAVQAERAAADSANREIALEVERKAARDARYAARKSRSKKR